MLALVAMVLAMLPSVLSPTPAAAAGELWEPTWARTRAVDEGDHRRVEMELKWTDAHRPAYPKKSTGGLEFEVVMLDPDATGNRQLLGAWSK